MAKFVRPVFPELFASGTIIDGFTPEDKKQTSTLMEAIKALNVGVVIVIDNERLQKEINEKLAEVGMENKTVVIKVPKSQGIDQQRRQSAEETERVIFNEYTDYFRGRHFQVIENNQQKKVEIGLEEMAIRKELDPQLINLPLDKIRIYEVIGSMIDTSALPASSTAPEETTFTDEIRPNDLEKNISKYKHKILAAVLPRDVQMFKQLEARIAQNPNNDQLNEDFKEYLLRSCTTEFLQIKDFRVDPKTQKKQLDVVRTCANKVNMNDRDGGAALIEDRLAIGGLAHGLNTCYFMMSKFTLKKMVI